MTTSENECREAFENWVTAIWRPDDGAELLKKEFPRFAYAAWQAATVIHERNARQAALQSIAQPVKVPDGWRLVPIKPNLAMAIAAENYVGRHAWAKMIEVAPAYNGEKDNEHG